MIPRIHRFGDFRLAPAARSLHRGGEELTLPAKAFDCIVYLVEHRERAVGRDELIAAVWDKIDVSDGVLGQTILVARRALDDTGREQTMIRTLLRFKDAPEENCDQVNTLLDERIEHVAARIKELRALQQELRDLREQCGASRAAAACGILSGLDQAANTAASTGRASAQPRPLRKLGH